ncbi:MAG: hypothetical protein E5W03_20885, partial [Mesorhizobium sp.]
MVLGSMRATLRLSRGRHNAPEPAIDNSFARVSAVVRAIPGKVRSGFPSGIAQKQRARAAAR